MRTTVLSYLEESASRWGDKVAFFDAEHEITFTGLRTEAIRLACAIKNRLSGGKQPILIYLPKNVAGITAMVGILYSGNFYTPTDVRFPAGKIISLLDALKPAAVVVNNETERRFASLVNNNSIPLINMDQTELSDNLDVSETIGSMLDTDPIYVLFTSGSTGTPKGVVITHRNVIDYTDWAARTLRIDEHTVMGNQSPFYFDASVQDIYTALKSGASTGLIPPTYFAFPVKVLQFLKDRHINFISWVPSAFVDIANYKLLDSFCLDEITTISFAGEVMPVKQLNYWMRHLPNLELAVNIYGATEAAVNCAYYIVDREFSDADTLPMGKPCENTGMILLDGDDKLVTKKQPGVQGEICIYGSCLSPGYWDDAGKTAEKFVPNPLCRHYGERMYRTGDLASYNERGELVYRGRMDSQIKHLGCRIELGELECAAMGCEEVKAACAAYDSEGKEIILFYDGNITGDVLRVHMAAVLPKYSVPSVYIKKNNFPHNDNGKVDRRRMLAEYLTITKSAKG